MKFYQGEVQLKKIVHLLEIELYMLLRWENTNHDSLLCSQGKTVGINMRKWIPDQGAGWQTPHQAVSSRASKQTLGYAQKPGLLWVLPDTGERPVGERE